MIFRYCKIIRYNTQKKLESSDRANYKLANILSLVLKVFEIKFEDPFLIYQKLVLRFTVTTPFTSGIFNKQLTSYCASHCSILKKKKNHGDIGGGCFICKYSWCASLEEMFVFRKIWSTLLFL